MNDETRKELALLLALEKKADLQPLVNPFAGAGIGMGAGYIGGKLWNWAAGGTDEEKENRVRKGMLLGTALGGVTGTGLSVFNAMQRESVPDASPKDTTAPVTPIVQKNEPPKPTSITTRKPEAPAGLTSKGPIEPGEHIGDTVKPVGEKMFDKPEVKTKPVDTKHQFKEEQRQVVEENLSAAEADVREAVDLLENPAKYPAEVTASSLNKLRNFYLNASRHGFVLKDYDRVVNFKQRIQVVEDAKGGLLIKAIPGSSPEEDEAAAKNISEDDVRTFAILARNSNVPANLRMAFANLAEHSALALEGGKKDPEQLGMDPISFLNKQREVSNRYFTRVDDATSTGGAHSLQERWGKLDDGNVGQFLSSAMKEGALISDIRHIAPILEGNTERRMAGLLGAKDRDSNGKLVPLKDETGEDILPATVASLYGLNPDEPNLVKKFGPGALAGPGTGIVSFTAGEALLPGAGGIVGTSVARRAVGEALGTRGGFTTLSKGAFDNVVETAKKQRDHIEEMANYIKSNGSGLSPHNKEVALTVLGQLLDNADKTVEGISNESYKAKVTGKIVEELTTDKRPYKTVISGMLGLDDQVEKIQDEGTKNLVRSAMAIADRTGMLGALHGYDAVAGKAGKFVASKTISPLIRMLASRGKLIANTAEEAAALAKSMGPLKQVAKAPKPGFFKNLQGNAVKLGVAMDLAEYVTNALYDPEVQNAFSEDTTKGMQKLLAKVADQPRVKGTEIGKEILDAAFDKSKDMPVRMWNTLTGIVGKGTAAGFGYDTLAVPSALNTVFGWGDDEGRGVASGLFLGLGDPDKYLERELWLKAMHHVDEVNPILQDVTGGPRSSFEEYMKWISPKERELARRGGFFSKFYDSSKLSNEEQDQVRLDKWLQEAKYGAEELAASRAKQPGMVTMHFVKVDKDGNMAYHEPTGDGKSETPGSISPFARTVSTARAKLLTGVRMSNYEKMLSTSDGDIMSRLTEKISDEPSYYVSKLLAGKSVVAPKAPAAVMAKVNNALDMYRAMLTSSYEPPVAGGSELAKTMYSAGSPIVNFDQPIMVAPATSGGKQKLVTVFSKHQKTVAEAKKLIDKQLSKTKAAPLSAPALRDMMAIREAEMAAMDKRYPRPRPGLIEGSPLGKLQAMARANSIPNDVYDEGRGRFDAISKTPYEDLVPSQDVIDRVNKGDARAAAAVVAYFDLVKGRDKLSKEIARFPQEVNELQFVPPLVKTNMIVNRTDWDGSWKFDQIKAINDNPSMSAADKSKAIMELYSGPGGPNETRDKQVLLLQNTINANAKSQSTRYDLSKERSYLPDWHTEVVLQHVPLEEYMARKLEDLERRLSKGPSKGMVKKQSVDLPTITWPKDQNDDIRSRILAI